MEEKELKKKILEALKEKGPMSAWEMHQYLGADYTQTAGLMYAMFYAGEIKINFVAGKVPFTL